MQVLREIAYAYARATGRQDASALAKQQRSDASSTTYWVDIANQPDPDQIVVRAIQGMALPKPYGVEGLSPGFHALGSMDRGIERGTASDARSETPPLSSEIVLHFMSRPRPRESFTDYMLARLEDAALVAASEKAGTQRHLGEFVTTTLGIMSRFSEFLVAELSMEAKGIKVFPLVTRNNQASARNVVAGRRVTGAAGEVAARPLPAKYYKLVREILEEGEHGWPGKCSLCIEIIGGLEVYCPVLPTLFPVLVPFTPPRWPGQAPGQR